MEHAPGGHLDQAEVEDGAELGETGPPLPADDHSAFPLPMSGSAIILLVQAGQPRCRETACSWEFVEEQRLKTDFPES